MSGMRFYGGPEGFRVSTAPDPDHSVFRLHGKPREMDETMGQVLAVNFYVGPDAAATVVWGGVKSTKETYWRARVVAETDRIRPPNEPIFAKSVSIRVNRGGGIDYKIVDQNLQDGVTKVWSNEDSLGISSAGVSLRVRMGPDEQAAFYINKGDTRWVLKRGEDLRFIIEEVRGIEAMEAMQKANAAITALYRKPIVNCADRKIAELPPRRYAYIED